MILAEIWKLFEESVFGLPSSPRLFNPYRDTDPRMDRVGAASIRRENLFRYLSSFPRKPSLLLIGEAAGPWDCRFSGIPFTGERQLCRAILPFPGNQSSRMDPSTQIRKMPPYSSNSATVFWNVLHSFHPQFFVWNAVPCHPHHDGRPLSVRNPLRGELRRFSENLKSLAHILQATMIIAVGRKAEEALTMAGLPCVYVRHPSQGGAKSFAGEMEKIFAAARP